MLKTNKDRLVQISTEGKVAPSVVWMNTVGRDGKIRNLPACGGITYNVLVGDSAFGWAADHLEPAVSAVVDPKSRSDKFNTSFNFLCCAGNKAHVISGKAEGEIGTVIGTHGGVEHVMIDFPLKTLEKMAEGDRIHVRAYGQSLELTDYPTIACMSLDPHLLEKMKIKEKKKKIEIPVAAIVPGKLMGSGLGVANVHTADYDIMTGDEAALKEHKLTNLKLGDIVAVTDMDAAYGWHYFQGAVMIGIIIHGDSFLAGHGPGVTTIMNSTVGDIIPVLHKEANIGKYFGLGRYRK
ncbi:MAG: hypothetical protein A3I05_01660 [Deltaproteobacteria bacterium RIFCSPLOWO2_02_FULL_44_10]|nr:MAG: hypothetical protein A3C46_05255 [Deltaproteobacteria bacterium RIFCSPHIGHO2_02_FULL_44_16]OGQ45356.1 MAG: hypothetical protein A3I05_01660 [Deltaproteobacteria bacterium RIFCSPLOWO2_02_FULL_44_10]